MYYVDNSTGVSVMPAMKPVYSTDPTWFTEGDSEHQPTYPGPDTYNMIIAEMMNVLAAAGIVPKKDSLTQLSESIQAIVSAGISGAVPDGKYLETANNLSEIAAAGADAQAAGRQSLGLGNAAPLNVGTTAGTVAAGDDARFGTGLTWDDIYPVGSEFSSYTDSRNPADIIGVGTWSPVVGLLAGVGAATDSSGYTANYTAGYQAGWWRVQNGHIVAQELQLSSGSAASAGTHHHGSGVACADGEQTIIYGAYSDGGVRHVASASDQSYDSTNAQTSDDGAHEHSVSGQITIGSGAATEGVAFFNPYYGKYIWVRTA